MKWPNRSLFGLILSILIYCPFASASTVFHAGDEDEAIVNDRFATWMISALGYTNIVDGDFDGDGHMDLAIVAKSATDGHTEVNLFLGQHSNPPSSFSTDAHLRVFVNSSFHVPIEMVDVNLDHKEDLVLGDWEKHGDKGQVSIILGETGVTRTVDMTNTLPDVQIIGEPGSYLGFAFGRGDFNGDKNVDLFLGGWQKSYFMFGRSGMTSGTTFDLSVATFPRISMNLYDSSVGILGHDIDHDGDDDLIVPSADIDIIHGDPNFPSRPVTDLRVVRSPTTNAIFCPAVGDLTGDGRPEMVIVGYSLLPVFRPLSAVLNGSDLLSGQSVVNLDPASVNPVTPQALPVSIRSIFSSAIGDFDGDGKNDLFFVGTSTEGVLQPYLWAYLSSGFEGKNPLESLQTPTFVWDRPFECIKLVDMNGDGLKDLVTYDNVGSLAPFGAIRIMYGYRLLLDPTVSIGARQGNSPRATLTLSVKGDPVEMMISGDIIDSFKDQWIPYQTHPDVTFSSNEGSKTVRARFRNAYRRESETIEASCLLSVENQQASVRTNRIKPGGRAVVDCSLTFTGRIKAAVYNRLGEKVKDLLDEERGPGIWPVEWDGQNSEGHFVSPGFYVLVVESAGQTTKTTLMVQK